MDMVYQLAFNGRKVTKYPIFCPLCPVSVTTKRVSWDARPLFDQQSVELPPTNDQDDEYKLSPSLIASKAGTTSNQHIF